jgi:hypothetical protein
VDDSSLADWLDSGWPFSALALKLGSLDDVFGGNGKINGEVGKLIGQLIE